MSGKTKKVIHSFEQTDSMTPSLRQCVHEYGFAIVQACLQAGVRNPAAIHQLVREIWEGARQPRQRRPRAGTLDWLLLQAGAEISAATIIRVLRSNDFVVVPVCPTAAMVAASMKEVSGFTERVTKEEKHRRRLRAALMAGGEFLLAKVNRETET